MKNFINEVEGNPVGESKMIILKEGRNSAFWWFFSLKNFNVLQRVLKSVNLRYITMGWLDDDMIVPPSDGPMFILINWE